jgi:hypothetical protein
VKKPWMIVVLAAMLISSATALRAEDFTVAPFTYSAVGLGVFIPAGGPKALARWERVSGDWQLYLAKNVDTSEIAAAGAQLNGVKGISTTDLRLGFTVEEGHCGAGAPRFNVRLASGGLPIFLGCAHASDVNGVRTFEAGVSYGGQIVPEGEVIESISILFDEGTDQGDGFVRLDDIFVNADTVGAPQDNRRR